MSVEIAGSITGAVVIIGGAMWKVITDGKRFKRLEKQSDESVTKESCNILHGQLVTTQKEMKDDQKDVITKLDGVSRALARIEGKLSN